MIIFNPNESGEEETADDWNGCLVSNDCDSNCISFTPAAESIDDDGNISSYSGEKSANAET